MAWSWGSWPWGPGMPCWARKGQVVGGEGRAVTRVKFYIDKTAK